MVSVAQIKDYIAMCREGGVARLKIDGLEIDLFQAEAPLPPRDTELEAFLSSPLPSNPLEDPSTYSGGGVPTFRTFGVEMSDGE